MHHAPPSRRALGIAAVGALALSTTAVAFGGVAAAAPGAPGVPAAIPFSSDEDAQVVVPSAGYCSVEWHLVGASGGSGYVDGFGLVAPGPVGEIIGTSAVTGGEVFSLFGGTAGTDATEWVFGFAGTSDAVVPGHVTGGENGGVQTYIHPDVGEQYLQGGGGGGAAAVVTGPDDFLLLAHGGDGGSNPGRGGGRGSNVVDPSVEVDVNGAATVLAGSAGVVRGEVLPCAPVSPPLAPTGLVAIDGNRKAEVLFHVNPAGTAADRFEYSRDGGTSWIDTVHRWNAGYGMTAITVDIGLTNGISYTVRVRGVSDSDGAGAASEPIEIHPYWGASAPQGVTVTPGVASVRVEWAPVEHPGSFPVAGYAVDLISVGGQSGNQETVCESAVDAPRTCLVGLDTEAGVTYSVVVTTVDSVGHPGADSAVLPVGQVASPSVPSSVPASDGPISRSDGGSGSIAVGSTVVLAGEGYLPGSTVTLIVYSEPQVLAHTIADAGGRFEVGVVIPAGLASGNHTLVASGVDADGNPRFGTLPITVTGGTTGSGGLAYTGASVAVPAIGGLAALAVGGGLVLAGRRRRTAE